MKLVTPTPTIERSSKGDLLVSSQTIAEGADVTHQAVLKLIEQHSARLGQVGFEIRAGYNNSKVRIALLTEKQSTVLMMLMKNTEKALDFKFALNDAFFAMAEQLNNTPALTNEQIVAQALQITTAQVKELSSKLEAAQPKADYVDAFVADNDYHLFRTIASDLNVGEGELRWALVYTGWIYHDQQKRRNSKGEIVTEHLWSEYADKKQYFFRALNHQAPLFKGNVKYTLKLTTPGVAAVSRLVQRLVSEHGSLKSAIPELERKYNTRKVAA